MGKKFLGHGLRWGLVGALVLAQLLFWWFENAAQRGITFTPPAQPIAWTDVPQGGVNLPGLHLEQPDVVERTFALIEDAGIRWARVQFPWEDIEIHGRGDFRDYRHDYNGDGQVNADDAISAWDKYDQLVERAAAHNVQLIVRLDRPPEWARQQLPLEPHQVAQREVDPGWTGPPDNLDDYGAYVRAVVGRYRGQVRFFQIWNEPNYGHEWSWADPDPAAFVALLKVGYTQAKAANPDAVILFPSLTPADGLDWQAMSDLEFLEQVYAHGGGQYFDIFSAQLYGLGQPPDENRYVRPLYNDKGQLRRDLLLSRPLDSRTDVTRAVLLREIMERNGDSNKAMWISEFGWNSHIGPHPFGLPVTEEQKAAYIVGLMQRARREWPWMGVMNVWFFRAGAGFNPADPTVDFQLVTNDWQPLPAYSALKAYLSAPPVVGPGVYTPAHPAIIQNADGWTLHFWGTAADIGSASAVTLDGQPAQAPLSGLPLAEHTLQGHGAPPAAVTISRANRWSWLWTSAPFALLLALLVALRYALLPPRSTTRSP